MGHWTDRLTPEQVKDDRRAVRRHDRWRMVQRAVRLFRMYDQTKNAVLDHRGLSVKRRAHDPERLADNLANCTCLCCKNPHVEKWVRRRELADPSWDDVMYVAYESHPADPAVVANVDGTTG